MKINKDEIIDVEDLTIEHLKIYPVWEFVTSREEEYGETAMIPIKNYPVASMKGRIIGTEVTLNNGQKKWASMGSLHPNNSRRTQQFLNISIYSDDDIFHLARYFDSNYDIHGPEGLAKFLNLEVDVIFPISYDVSKFVLGDNTIVPSI